jgi:hypothetical protein
MIICALIRGRGLFIVMYVRNLSITGVLGVCIYTIILGSGHINVMYVRNLSGILVL